MQAQTATTPSEAATGSRTLADLLPLAGEKHGDFAGPAVQGPGQGRVGGRLLLRAGLDREGGLARPPGARHQARGQGRDPVEHPPGVDLLGLRDPGCGGNRGAHLPDELARGVPLRARPLGGHRGDRRGRGAAREDPQDPRRPAAPRARGLDGEAGRRRRDQLRRAARKGPLRVRRGLQEPHRIGGGLGRRHLHLHLRHDRPSEGLHHRPPELARHARHGRGAERARWSRRSPISSCRSRTRSRG